MSRPAALPAMPAKVASASNARVYARASTAEGLRPLLSAQLVRPTGATRPEAANARCSCSPERTGRQHCLWLDLLSLRLLPWNQQESRAGLEDSMLRTTAGPDPGVGTSAPSICHERCTEGPSAFHRAMPMAAPHSSTLSAHPH